MSRCGYGDTARSNLTIGARRADDTLAGKALAAVLLVEPGWLQAAYTRRIEPSDLDGLVGVSTRRHLYLPIYYRVEDAYDFWQQAGQSHYDQFGVTASTTDQYVWYAHPDSKHRWPRPAL